MQCSFASLYHIHYIFARILLEFNSAFAFFCYHIVDSLNGVDKEKIQENMRILALIREALRKRYRRQAVKTLIIDIVLCSVLFVAVYFLLPRLSEGSSVVQFVLAWKNLIFGAMCLGVLAFSFSQTGMMKV